MRKLLLVIAFVVPSVCSAQIDLFSQCPSVTWRETVDKVRTMFPYSSTETPEPQNADFYTALSIENVTFCGIPLKGRAVFSSKSHTLVRLVFSPVIGGDAPNEASMVFGYFRGLLFAKLGAPKILEPYQKKVVYSGKYEWKKDNMYVSVNLFSGDNYGQVSLMYDSSDWETLMLGIQQKKSGQ